MIDTFCPQCYNLSEISEDRTGVGEPIIWGESCLRPRGDLGALTRQLTPQEYTKSVLLFC